ncbi:carboxypeptidase regulatory-like domain-containing protein [bacterium]|nr:carboxypeptidase regulatory-like domain-containing protein [bacterium]
MFNRRSIGALVLCAGLLLNSCSTLITAYLVNELLNDEAPRYKWTGVVQNTAGDPVEDVKVEVRGEVSGDDNVAVFSDTTDNTGSYSITFRYNGNISYKVRVSKDGQVLAEQSFGEVEKGDKTTNFTLQGTVNATISGTVEDSSGDPIEDVLLVAASVDELDETPTVLLDSENNPRYVQSGESGIYSIEGSIGAYAIICAYHPDHGFAYGYAEDSDGDGSVAINLVMGAEGSHEVRVRVVDSGGNPIVLQVLSANQQFRLRLDTRFNLGETVDEVVSAEALFPGLVGVPSDSHPQAETLSVQATSLGGFAEGSLTVPGSTYEISLLNISSNEPATAIVNTANPLAVDGDETIDVRVN